MADWSMESRWKGEPQTGTKQEDPIEALINRLDANKQPVHELQSPATSRNARTEPVAAQSGSGQGFDRGEGNPQAPSVVIVDKSAHMTHIFQKDASTGEVKEVFSTRDATGKNPKWTPEGRYTVVEHQEHPWWYPTPSMHKKPVPPGDNNPLGPRKIRLANGKGEWTNIEMHGTSDPKALGTNASHGCIRHSNDAIKKMYPLIHLGTPVYITDHYNPKALIKQADFLP